MFRMNYISRLLLLIVTTGFCNMIFTSCLGEGVETIPLESQKGTNTVVIPSDDSATPNPLVETNTSLPNFGNWDYTDASGNKYIDLLMPGVRYPDSNVFLYLVGTGGKGTVAQNVWVSVDGKPKGCVAYNNYSLSGEIERPMRYDVVFLVDNSGNMNNVGETLASDMQSLKTELKSANLDVRYGCVGYSRRETFDSEVGVNGAMDICDADVLLEYLNRDNLRGVLRTKGYGGTNAAELKEVSEKKYSNCEGVCPVEALRFADEMFNFRAGACRVYINFIDEANQPNGNEAFSVEYVKTQNVWPSYKGSIYTVFNGNKEFNEQPLYYEWPWKLSQYTGGAETYLTNNIFTLTGLPAVNVMKCGYVIRFRNSDAESDGQYHDVKVTIRSVDAKVQAEKTYKVKF